MSDKVASTSSIADYMVDAAKLDEGVWVKPDEDRSLRVKVRNYSDRYIDSRAARLRRAAAQYGGDTTRIPNDKGRMINVDLLLEFILVDVDGLSNRDGSPVTLSQFQELMRDPNCQPLVAAVQNACTIVTNMRIEDMKEALGNSPQPSASP